MGKRVADQHEVVERWREIADELAEALRGSLISAVPGTPRWRCSEAALHRYEEARNG